MPPTATPVPPTATPEPTGPRAGETAITLVQGSEARYLIREQLARLSFPNDAIGKTSRVTGEIIFDAEGVIQQDRSNLTVNLASLASDSGNRDRFVRNNTLQTSRFPDAVFVPKVAAGLPWPVPTSGEVEFRLIGDMTIRDVTAPLTWDGVGTFTAEGATGRVKTAFKFELFDMDVPSLRILLSVENNIRLELDFVVAVTKGS